MKSGPPDTGCLVHDSGPKKCFLTQQFEVMINADGHNQGLFGHLSNQADVKLHLLVTIWQFRKCLGLIQHTLRFGLLPRNTLMGQGLSCAGLGRPSLNAC